MMNLPGIVLTLIHIFHLVFHCHFKKRAEAVIEAARKEIAYKNEGQVCVTGRLRAGVLKPSTGQLVA